MLSMELCYRNKYKLLFRDISLVSVWIMVGDGADVDLGICCEVTFHMIHFILDSNMHL